MEFTVRHVRAMFAKVSALDVCQGPLVSVVVACMMCMGTYALGYWRGRVCLGLAREFHET